MKNYSWVFYLLLLGGGGWWVGSASGYYVGLNDFWAFYLELALQVRLPQFADATYPTGYVLYGFYPVGYPLFLRLFPAGEVVRLAFLSNLALGIALLAGGAWAVTRRWGIGWGWLVMLFLSLHPLIFIYSMTPGPDIGCGAFGGLAFFLLMLIFVREEAQTRPWVAALAGILLGLSALWRYHGLVLAAGLLGAAFWLYKEHRRSLLWAGGGVAATYLLQVIVNLLSHRGPFETLQAFNVYKLTHGIVWYHIPPDIPYSMTAVIAGAPQTFLSAYVGGVASSLILVVPALLGAWLLTRRAERRLCLWVAGAAAFYILVVSLGDSPRGNLPLIPLFALTLVLLTRHAVHEWRGRRAGGIRFHPMATLLLLVVLGFGLAGWIREDGRFVYHAAERHATFTEVQRVLVEEEGVVNPLGVFSSDFDIYLPDTPPHRMFAKGGWGVYVLRYLGLEALAPDLNAESMAAFLSDCRGLGISHLVLHPEVGDLLPELRAIYDGSLTTAELEPVGNVADYKIYRLRTPPTEEATPTEHAEETEAASMAEGST